MKCNKMVQAFSIIADAADIISSVQTKVQNLVGQFHTHFFFELQRANTMRCLRFGQPCLALDNAQPPLKECNLKLFSALQKDLFLNQL